MDMARKENLTMRQIALRVAGARGKAVVKGSPTQIADQMEEWFREDGCDGFNLMPPFLPGGLDDFVELVLPGAAPARPVPHRIRRPHAARASWPARGRRAATPPGASGRAVARIGLSGSGACHTGDIERLEARAGPQ